MKVALAVLGTSFVLAGCAAGPKEPDHAAHRGESKARLGRAACRALHHRALDLGLDQLAVVVDQGPVEFFAEQLMASRVQ